MMDRNRNENSIAEPRTAAYDAIAQRIIGYRAATGQRPGIYGANRCQLCGAITTFSTLAGARMAHFGSERERACAACVKWCGRDAVAAAIEALTERRCEICGHRVERSPTNRLGSYWVCEPCRHDVGPGDQLFGPADGLNQLVRRRYMALAYPTVGELLQLEETVLAIKADLDAIASQPTSYGEHDDDGDGPASLTIVGFPSSGRLR
jgi:hypothetical protein